VGNNRGYDTHVTVRKKRSWGKKENDQKKKEGKSVGMLCNSKNDRFLLARSERVVTRGRREGGKVQFFSEGLQRRGEEKGTNRRKNADVIRIPITPSSEVDLRGDGKTGTRSEILPGVKKAARSRGKGQVSCLQRGKSSGERRWEQRRMG